MSQLVNQIIESITDAKDIPKVLRDVAIALNTKGYFQNSNWRDDVIQNFRDAIDVQVDDTISNTDNEHEISSSFIADGSSKFNTKSKTSIHTGYQSISKDDLFEDSNDSFEIPETQAFPPIDHPSDDEHDSEGFITMPDDEFEANDCSQSQILLQVTERMGKQSPHQPDFNESDSVDMEMSILRWDDSTKENDKVKSASVTPELDFDLMTKPIDPAFSATSDLGFEEMSSALTKSVFEALNSRQASIVSKAPSSLERNEITKSSSCDGDKSSTREKSTNNNQGLGIERIDRDNRQTSANVKCADDEELPMEKDHRDGDLQDRMSKDDKADEGKKVAQTVDNGQATENVPADEDADYVRSANENDKEKFDELQTKSKEVNEPVENLNQCDDDVAETQFFLKSGEGAENRTEVRVPDEQLFKKPAEVVAGKMPESNHVSVDADDVDENLDATQLFFKPNASSTEEDDDAYNMETQALDIAESNPGEKNPISLAEDGPEGDANNQHTKIINVDVANGGAREESDEPGPRLRKLNRLIESSDEEDDENDAAADDADYDAQTQIFETRKPATPRRKRISDLKGGDWQQLCDEANNSQSNVVFKSVFDQCKDLRKVHANNEPVAASTTNQNIVAKAPTARQSVRTRTKVKHEESSDAEAVASKRQKTAIEPITFKTPFDSVPKKSNKAQPSLAADQSPPPEVKASEGSSKQDDDAEENVAVDMPHTQVFVKAPSASKEQTSKRDLSRRQARAVSTEPTGAPKDSSKVSSATAKSDNAPPPEVEASKGPSKQDVDAEENVAVDMLHTQVFVKKPSATKEQTSKRDLPRRQARAVPTEPADAQQPIPKLRVPRQSTTYSPKPAAVKATADVNENVEDPTVSAKSEKNDKQVPRQTRKRKAAADSNDSSVRSVRSSTRSRSPSVHRSTRNQDYSVMFTMLDPAPHKATLTKLNMSIADSGSYNVLVTDKIYRTSKFLCAVAAGKPIVSIEWLNELKTKKSIVDPFEFLLKDAVGEKKYRFDLAKTLDKVQENGGLCRNHSILITPNTTPSPDILKDVITCSGGKYLKTSLPARKNDAVICISNEQDSKLVAQLKKNYGSMKEITAEEFMQAIFHYKI